MRTRTTLLAMAFAITAVHGSGPINGHAPSPETMRDKVNASSTAIGSSGFEENKGQVRTTSGDAAPFVRYRLSQGDASIFLLENGIAYQFNRMHFPEGYHELEGHTSYHPEKQELLDSLRQEVHLETYRMDMLPEGANPSPRITTEGRSSDYTNYYTHDVLDVRTYSKVTYHDVWPGIDWVVYTTKKGMKYDFVVHPGADPARIRLRFKDHEELYVDGSGRLVHGNRMGRFTEERPVSYQNGKQVGTRFLVDGNMLRFDMDKYDKTKVLTIDPDRVWGTFYGGSNTDQGDNCALDGNGNIYLSGGSYSTGNIATTGGHQTVVGGGADAYLAKFNAGTGQRIWATYYGGSANDWGFYCAVDGGGNVYLSGRTHGSANLATSGAHQPAYGGGDSDAFLVKFNSNGQRQWGTYFGGSGADGGAGLSIDENENVYCIGWTNSIGLSGAISPNVVHQSEYGGVSDGFVVKFDPAGLRQWSTYYGGTGWEQGLGCAATGAYVYLAGATQSTSSIAGAISPFTPHQSTYGGGNSNGGDAFLVKFNGNGERIWGTYYGGSVADGTNGAFAVAGNGNVFLHGWTDSSNGIATAGSHQPAYGLGTDAFLVKFNTDGVREWGTYYGGLGWENGVASAITPNGDVYMTGFTESFNGIHLDGYDSSLGGDRDAFIVKFDGAGGRIWGSYYGGNGSEEARYGVKVDVDGSVYFIGNTNSPDNAVASIGAHQSAFGGGSDAFLVKFEGGPVGIGELAANIAFQTHPNPTSGLVSITFAEQVHPRSLSVFDATGRIVLEQSVTSKKGTITCDLSAQERGVYLVHVMFRDGTKAVERVVKE